MKKFNLNKKFNYYFKKFIYFIKSFYDFSRFMKTSISAYIVF
jgi:hypothetical protein